jgi:hypothetical protein
LFTGHYPGTITEEEEQEEIYIGSSRLGIMPNTYNAEYCHQDTAEDYEVQTLL